MAHITSNPIPKPRKAPQPPLSYPGAAADSDHTARRRLRSSRHYGRVTQLYWCPRFRQDLARNSSIRDSEKDPRAEKCLTTRLNEVDYDRWLRADSEGAHFLEALCLVSALTLPYCNCTHLCPSWVRILNQAACSTLRTSDRST
jgi:hypothetical protein